MGTITVKDTAREATCDEELRAMRDCIFVLGGKWRLQIIRYLANRQDDLLNFTKIQNEIGISPKVLSNELATLEVNGLILRTQSDDKVPKVFYRISDYGKTSLPLIERIVQWGLDHRTKISNS